MTDPGLEPEPPTSRPRVRNAIILATAVTDRTSTNRRYIVIGCLAYFILSYSYVYPHVTVAVENIEIFCVKLLLYAGHVATWHRDRGNRPRDASVLQFVFSLSPSVHTVQCKSLRWCNSPTLRLTLFYRRNMSK